jgi:copper chaperone CopZ
MNLTCLAKSTNLHEQNQHASSIRPVINNIVRMRTIKLFFAIALLIAIGTTVSAQTGTKTSGPKTESFKVSGACGMCKTRIEKTAKEEGATSAAWDAKTQLVTVTFDPSKTSVDALSKKLASVGHDTEKYKADDKVYNALPGCCHYERSK